MSPHQHGERATLQRRHVSFPDSHARVGRSPDLLGKFGNTLGDVNKVVDKVGGDVLNGVAGALSKLEGALSTIIAPQPTPTPSTTQGNPTSSSTPPATTTTADPHSDLGSIVDGLVGGVLSAVSKVINGPPSSSTPSPTSPSTSPGNPIDKLTEPIDSLLTNVIGIVSSLGDGLKSSLSLTLPVPPVTLTTTATTFPVVLPTTTTEPPAIPPTTTTKTAVFTLTTNSNSGDPGTSSSGGNVSSTKEGGGPPTTSSPGNEGHTTKDGTQTTNSVPNSDPTSSPTPPTHTTNSGVDGGNGSSSQKSKQTPFTPSSSLTNKTPHPRSTPTPTGTGTRTTTITGGELTPSSSSIHNKTAHPGSTPTPTGTGTGTTTITGRELTPSSSITHNSEPHPGSKTSATGPRTGTTITTGLPSSLTRNSSPQPGSKTTLTGPSSQMTTTTVPPSQIIPINGTLSRDPRKGVRVTSTYDFATTNSNGQSIFVSGTYTSYIGSPTGSHGGGGSHPFGGIGVGGLAAIIALVVLFILTCFIILLRRHRARRRADRLQGWLTAWRRNHEDQGIEGGPQMAQRRPLSDISFGTPEHPLSRSMSLARSLPYSPTCVDPFASNELISVSSSFSDQSGNPHPPRVPFAPVALTREQGEVFERVLAPVSPATFISPPSPGPTQPQATLSTAPTAFRSKAFRKSRISQLTIKPVPFDSTGRVVISRQSSVRSLQSQSDQSHLAERRGSMMTEASGEYTAKSVDLMAFPRPPSNSKPTHSNVARSILDPRDISRASLQSIGQANMGAGDLLATPARSDFKFAAWNFGSRSQYSPDGCDPFADTQEHLPSPMASSAVRSIFFPGDGSDAQRSSAKPSNLTHIARSWAPASLDDTAEELAVHTGDVVRVISRHSVLPNLSEEQLSVNNVQGGWALVKRLDPETGISKRGYVPINCLMDVQGPPLYP